MLWLLLLISSLMFFVIFCFIFDIFSFLVVGCGSFVMDVGLSLLLGFDDYGVVEVVMSFMIGVSCLCGWFWGWSCLWEKKSEENKNKKKY